MVSANTQPLIMPLFPEKKKKKKLLTITQVRFKNPSLANHLASPYSRHKLDTRSWAVTSLPLDHEKITH